MFQRIKSVISPMKAMRIDSNLDSAADLQNKLHMITQYLLNATKQFDAWMQLQNNNRLHYSLYEIYETVNGHGVASTNAPGTRTSISEDQLINIIQFYSMLLMNCKDELLICKLVSDDFVIQLCQLTKVPKQLGFDLQAYQMNLIKSYMSKITQEVVKYMVIQDKFKVFTTCIQLFCNKLGTGTVQFTTMSNIVLNIMKKVDEIPYLWENVWVTQGLQLFYTECFLYTKQLMADQFVRKNSANLAESIKEQKNQKQSQNINSVEISSVIPPDENQVKSEDKQQTDQLMNQNKIDSIDQKSQIKQQEKTMEQNQKVQAEQLKIQQKNDSEQKIQQKQVKIEPKQSSQQVRPFSGKFNLKNTQPLEQIILFLVEIRLSVTNASIYKLIEQYSYMYLQEILEIVGMYSDYTSKVYTYSILHALFKTYSFEREAVEAVMTNWFGQLLTYLGNQYQQQDKEQQIKNSQDKVEKINELPCRSIFVLSKIVASKYSNLSERIISEEVGAEDVQKTIFARQNILKILVQKVGSCIQLIQCSSPPNMLMFIKHLLLTVFNLKLAMSHQALSPKLKNSSQSEENKLNKNKIDELFEKLNQSILELFLTYISELRKIMQNTQLWSHVIKCYQQCSNRVASHLLSLPDTYERICQDNTYLVMLTYEYIKNYRYMLIQETTLDPKAIKQQKFYHTTFTSPGISYQPGKTIVNQNINIVCPCLFHFNYQQIPVVVIEDKECFIVAVKLKDGEFKIMINVQFKDIDGLIYGNSQSSEGKNSAELPKFVKINLRGAQQIILQFNNPKVVGNAFKDYLIKSRDMMRQRQLTFLNNWIKDYQADTNKCLEIVKQRLNKEDYRLP